MNIFHIEARKPEIHLGKHCIFTSGMNQLLKALIFYFYYMNAKFSFPHFSLTHVRCTWSSTTDSWDPCNFWIRYVFPIRSWVKNKQKLQEWIQNFRFPSPLGKSLVIFCLLFVSLLLNTSDTTIPGGTWNISTYDIHVLMENILISGIGELNYVFLLLIHEDRLLIHNCMPSFYKYYVKRESPSFILCLFPRRTKIPNGWVYI